MMELHESESMAAAVPGQAAPALFSLREAAAWMRQAVVVGDGTVSCARVHTDTRSLKPGDLFVALKGDRHDANDFLAQARDQGAAAALCHRGASASAPGLPCIEVADTRRALGELATHWRARLQLPVIAVTGSNGKTTVTQMLAAILQAWRGEAALTTRGNLNNDIGVPLTLLRLRKAHQVAALELGMNHPGEIQQLTDMVRPQVALVNNAQREHLEFMGSVDAVARENGAVVSGLPPGGTAVFPLDDAHAALWRGLAAHVQAQVRGFAMTDRPESLPGLHVHAPQPRWHDGAWQVQARLPQGPLNFKLHVPGLHNVRNALAAATCALAAGAPAAAVCAGLETFHPVQGRSRAIPLQIGDKMRTLIDDSYNANPDSVAAALELLASLPAPRLMVLGDMGEVGADGELFHSQAGSLADQLGIERMFTHGQLSAAASRSNQHARHFEDMPALIAAVIEELPAVSSVLVKGSRFMRMERVVEAVTTLATPQQPDGHAA